MCTRLVGSGTIEHSAQCPVSVPAHGDDSHWVDQHHGRIVAPSGDDARKEAHMSKRGRKRKDRRKNSANHGKRPNS